MIVPFEHGNCPHCGVSSEGEAIWESCLRWAMEGRFHEQHGLPATDKNEAYQIADENAWCFGADRTKGRWRRDVRKCPDCEGEWDR